MAAAGGVIERLRHVFCVGGQPKTDALCFSLLLWYSLSGFLSSFLTSFHDVSCIMMVHDDL